MKNFHTDQNNNTITMYCVDCRVEGKPWEDCVAVIMVDNTTRCMQHFDMFVKRNQLNG